MITKQYEIELLNKDSVNINIHSYAEVDGETYLIKKEGKSYSNSTIGRKRLSQEIPEDFLNTIMTLWGETPTIDDPPYIAPTEEV